MQSECCVRHCPLARRRDKRAERVCPRPEVRHEGNARRTSLGKAQLLSLPLSYIYSECSGSTLLSGALQLCTKKCRI